MVINGTTGPVDGIDVAYAPRRTVLDKILVDAAREASSASDSRCTAAPLREDLAHRPEVNINRVTRPLRRGSSDGLLTEPAGRSLQQYRRKDGERSGSELVLKRAIGL